MYKVELSEAMRQNIGPRTNLIDWAVTGEDLAASITRVARPSGYVSDETLVPDWPRQRRPVRTMHTLDERALMSRMEAVCRKDPSYLSLIERQIERCAVRQTITL